MTGRQRRSFVKETVFWAFMLGLTALAVVLIHRSCSSYQYEQVMPIMLPIVFFVPLLTAALRYLPRQKSGLRFLGVVASAALAFGIGQFGYQGYYGESPFLIDFFTGKTIKTVVTQDLKSLSGTIYEADEAVSKEIPLDDHLAFLKEYAVEDLFVAREYRAVRGSVPEAKDFVQLHLVFKDGHERELRLYESGQWDCIEEPGVGVWRRMRAEDYIGDYAAYRKQCVEAEYGKAYEEPLLAGHVPSLLPEYDGGGKAAWMLTERIYDSLHYSNSWKNNRFGSEIVIPEKYVSKHARDVRWLFVQNETGRSYVGYEYVIKTGERVRDVYSSSYEVAVYDLVTGENRVYPLTNDRNALEEFINDYFADLEKDQNP